ncbi:MAG: ATP-grasp domain-containing protein [Bacteroidales bacterium]|nr:ATP-grasp domain-containing protein [Bacteroidales bacterium]
MIDWNTENIYWIGTRESDIDYINNLFRGSITIFGSNENNNIPFQSSDNERVNHNIPNDELNKFFLKEITELLKKDRHAKLMFYNPSFAYKLGIDIVEKCICVNDNSVLRFLANKIQSRFVFSNYVPSLQSRLFLGNQCTLKNICSFFPNKTTFVIQENSAAGGFGTYILEDKTEKDILPYIKNNESYLVSPYHQNYIPVNVHTIIFENQIIDLTPSVQIIERSKNRLLYKGADFVCFNQIDKNLQKKIRTYSKKISELLRISGYRGVCGIDFIINSEDAYFIEVNNRFQASSILLNRAFKENNLPSIQELTIRSFYEDRLKQTLNFNITIPYSCYSYHQETKKEKHSTHIFNRYNQEKLISSINLDGFNQSSVSHQDGYLFRLILNTNIASINEDKEVVVHDNIYGFIFNKNVGISEIKTRLMNQGIYITSNTKRNLEKAGGVRDAVFSAIDFNYENEVFINSPIDVKLTQLSPFKIDYSNNDYHLFCYNEYLFPINIDLKDNGALNITKSGIPFSKISKLATDRLRIHHQSLCYFKQENMSCKFCDLPKNGIPFDLDDIYEVIDYYLKQDNFNHFLIGGGSARPNYGWDRIIQLASYIKNKSSKKIYLMSLPPNNLSVLEELYKVGVDEVGFNIEIFDRKIAKKLMPGKSNIPIEQYYEALTESVKLWGNNGNVRSLIILGLEENLSLLKGIEDLCRIGVSPIISLFRPLPDTSLSNQIPSSYSRINFLLKEILKICSNYNISLGPSCTKCQNNTLSVVQNISYSFK